MPKKLSMPELIGRIAEITSRPSRELVEQVVVRVFQEHRDSPVEVQARAVIDAVQEVDAWRLDAPTEAETASRRAMIDAALSTSPTSRQPNETGQPVADPGWEREFDDPIPLPGGRQLVTLEDAAKYILKLPDE